MKKLHLFALVFALSPLLFIACDDDDGGSGNRIEVNGDSFPLSSSGILEDFGPNSNGSFDWDVYLVSDGVMIDQNGDLSGQGNIVYLDLNTNSASGLVSGTYQWSETREAFTMVDAAVGINVTQNMTGLIYQAVSGTAEVSVNGNNASIEFSITTLEGTAVTGQWEGVLTF